MIDFNQRPLCSALAGKVTNVQYSKDPDKFDRLLQAARRRDLPAGQQRKAEAKKAAMKLYTEIKSLHIEQFEADYVLVTKKEKYAFIKEQLEDDLGIQKFNPKNKRHNPCPSLQQSVYFEFALGDGSGDAETKDIYLAIKFAGEHIDRIAHTNKIFGDLLEQPIRFKFNRHM